MPARYAAVDVEALLSGRATIRSGYAAREQTTCRLGERDCGATVTPYHACCPENTGCVSLLLNARCCDPDLSETECSAALVKQAQCANPEHDLYDFDGNFCCEQGYKGYGNTKTQGDGCGTQDYVLKDKEKWLTIVVSGRAISSTASSKKTTVTRAPSATNPGNTSKTTSASTSTDASSTDTSSPTTTAPSGSATSTIGSSPTTSAPSAGAPSSTAAAEKTSSAGAIAGGVVGGIAALAILAFLIWFLRRRKAKKTYASATPQSPSGAYQAMGGEKDVPLAAMGKAGSSGQGDGGEGGVSELPGKERGDAAAAAELYGQEGAGRAEMYSPGGEGRAEMYSPSVATTAELHGVERGPGELPAWDGRGVGGGQGRAVPVELP
ncbi:hypothetical protein VE03_06627 [Pseudogymnoascus sp. 23342-1-I1]|nr:hypothetical protein VE03_06627 [Pseudogymnoascus sp. 23342-1-I1]